MPHPRAISSALTLAICCAFAAPAQASETLGETFSGDACGSNATIIQKSTGSAPGYQAQTTGVITSWSYRAVNNPPTIRLRVYRATADPAVWFARSQSTNKPPGTGAGQVKANTLNTFNEAPGIRIEAGDNLGLIGTGGNGISCSNTTAEADVQRIGPTTGPIGQNNGGFNGNLTKLRLGVSVVIEPDADADGFGDESQDQCPTEVSTQGPCPDADGDGLSNSVDACPNDSDVPAPRNPRTGCPADFDGDGIADPADGDDDNDGVPDAEDFSPFDPNVRVAPGTSGKDTINGTSVADVICGLGAGDTLNGLAGNDTLWGDACNDKAKSIFGSQSGTDGSDKLNGGEGNDSLYGAGGNDKLKGGNGKDKLFGGNGNDSLDGGAGKDSLDGGKGNDKLTGGKDTNKYKAGAGNDTVSARNSKKETVDCGAGKDTATVDRTDTVKGCETVRRPK